MMSKPLIFVCQLAGLILILGSTGRVELMVIGIVLVVIGGIGIRERYRNEKK